MDGLKTANELFNQRLLELSTFAPHESEENWRIHRLPENANGKGLLQAFVKMVTHREFSPENSHNGENPLEYHIVFSPSDEPIIVKCGSTTDQPGNAMLVGDKSYDELLKQKKFNLNEFLKDFKAFLQQPLKTSKENFINSKEHWQRSVLLVLEIARRIPDTNPEEHKFANLSVAAGISMVMQCPDVVSNQSEVFGLFYRQGSKKEWTKSGLTPNDKKKLWEKDKKARQDALSKIAEKWKKKKKVYPSVENLLETFGFSSSVGEITHGMEDMTVDGASCSDGNA